MRIDQYIITVFCFVDDILKEIFEKHPIRRRGFDPALHDSEVITMEIVGEFLGKDTDKGIWLYFHEHWKHFFPNIGSRSAFVRQAANLWSYKQIIQKQLSEKLKTSQSLIHIIDGFPIIISHFKRAYFSKLFKAEGTYGFCATKEQHYFGFKGHLLIDPIGVITDITVTAANIDERVAMREIVDGKVQGFLLGDKGYLVKEEVQQELKSINIDLQTPRRNNMTESRDPKFLKACSKKRRLIETVIGQLSTRFHIEKNWARKLWHFTNRITRKILSHTMTIMINLKIRSSPLDFDNLVTT